MQWVHVVRQQASTWVNVDPDICSHMVSLGHNGLIHVMLLKWNNPSFVVLINCMYFNRTSHSCCSVIAPVVNSMGYVFIQLSLHIGIQPPNNPAQIGLFLCQKNTGITKNRKSSKYCCIMDERPTVILFNIVIINSSSTSYAASTYTSTIPRKITKVVDTKSSVAMREWGHCLLWPMLSITCLSAMLKNDRNGKDFYYIPKHHPMN